MDIELEKKLYLAVKHKKENNALVKKLKRSKPKNLDKNIHRLHYEVFDEIDCLACANCCKTTSPAIYEKDIDRLAKHLKIKPSQLISQYLQPDEENDYVFKLSPCPFLGIDNYCAVYDNRPLACKEYPHTNRKRFYQVLDISMKNTEICPAVATIFEILKGEECW
jgi:Fe-S-cluster containining protein